jgi:hypothetical protein
MPSATVDQARHQQAPHSALGMRSLADFYAEWIVKNKKRPVQNQVGQYTPDVP